MRPCTGVRTPAVDTRAALQVSFPTSNVNANLTCTLCAGYFREPHTIKECLHTCEACCNASRASVPHDNVLSRSLQKLRVQVCGRLPEVPDVWSPAVTQPAGTDKVRRADAVPVGVVFRSHSVATTARFKPLSTSSFPA